MSTVFWTIVSYVARALLSLRYRIEVKGLETLTPDRLNRKGGILFLPNHPAHVDPLMLFVWLWPKFRMRPLVVEYVFRTPFLKLGIRLVRALPIPNFENAVNELKLRMAEKSVREIAEGLKVGDNFILYPAGRLKNTGKELLGGSSATHELMKECPDANVILIRTTGLWGSSFSRALIGRSPDLKESGGHAIKVLLKNLLFFAPRRRVLIEIEPNPVDFPRGDFSRIDLNRYLENWYNRYPDQSGAIHESEPLKLISYSRWREELPAVYRQKKKTNNNSGIHVSDETRRKITNEIKKILDRPDLEIEPEQNLAFDLGMDSLNIAELITYLAKNYDVGELHPEDMETVGGLFELAEGGKEERPPSKAPSQFTWPEEKHRLAPALPMGRTIPEAFLNSCQRMGSLSACGDDLVGVLTYSKMKRAVLVLAQYFKTWEEERVAVLLPASVGAYIVILALQMAGKTPVMLNWTLGSRYLEEMVKLSGARAILSSWRFLDRLPNVQFGSCIDKLVLLEDVRKSLTFKMKLSGALLAKCSVNQIVRAMGLDKIDENSPCVVLFTSGTEAVPKGVPLSHKNIISNQRSAMMCIDVDATDVLYGILPPFHSFGFSVAGLFPLLGGIRVAFYPDPTDSFALAEGIQRWKVSFFCSAPSFLKGLFAAAKNEQLRTIRYFVSGAEKAPKELFERVEKLKSRAQLVEGYGITECSPILTLNRPNLPPKGVGRVAPGIEMRTIHPETLEPIPEGKEGELCVRGDNVFSGYLGNPRTPFVQIDGQQWYRTGDLGFIDKEGNVILSGRLKRFTKVGGEMISLGAVEEIITGALLKQKRISPDVPSVAICSDESGGTAKLVLFVTVDLEKEEANQILHQAGFSNLVKISSVKKIEEIPLMGAGKTDYRSLQALC
ncbi:MAG TPA: AMP-binding protein [Chlamydiales bacterium]|nr:AMP-binding protein [Chlamydiales bacterium]